ncbi:hypothetical protein Tco_0776982 [Tanacetum coccineum]
MALLQCQQPAQENQLIEGNAACTRYYSHSPFGGWNGTLSSSALASLEWEKIYSTSADTLRETLLLICGSMASIHGCPDEARASSARSSVHHPTLAKMGLMIKRFKRSKRDHEDKRRSEGTPTPERWPKRHNHGVISKLLIKAVKVINVIFRTRFSIAHQNVCDIKNGKLNRSLLSTHLSHAQSPLRYLPYKKRKKVRSRAYSALS